MTTNVRHSIDDATEEEWDAVTRLAMNRQIGGDHYKGFKIQPIQYIMENDLSYCAANIIKYASRAEMKGGRQDIEKIIHYCELWLENWRD